MLSAAPLKKDALVVFDAFVETWGVKYDKAVERLTKNRDVLLAFYDFPAEHWKHLQTTDVLDKSFGLGAIRLFGPCASHSSIPTPHGRAATARSGRSRTAPSWDRPEGLVLNGREHGGRLVCVAGFA